MLSRSPIRFKILLGFLVLLVVVITLAVSSLRGVYAYRELLRSVQTSKLPLATRLKSEFASLSQLHDKIHENVLKPDDRPGREIDLLIDFGLRWVSTLDKVSNELQAYRRTLEREESVDLFLGDRRREWETVRQAERSLARTKSLTANLEEDLEPIRIGLVQDELRQLESHLDALPNDLRQRLEAYRDEVRVRYRSWIFLTWVGLMGAGLALAGLTFFSYRWIFRPLRILINGSRRVAAGEFSHRIELDTHDEVAELAHAMNAMTQRFQTIRDDLDQQVKLRTKEVVRSEQLASVGFLAAGVAHEINNPLASIAWCAESLESRLHDLFHGDEDTLSETSRGELEILQRYMQTIQDEAFRCKGITERLLDFSRLGDVEKQQTDLTELIRTVIDMVKDLGKYRQKNIEFREGHSVYARVNSQEIKQVVLNLITNALDSLDAGGTVDVRLQEVDGAAQLSVRDNGCGMTEEVRKHLFEPFFTRRRDGQGTGLGLSITYRIIEDHGGSLQAHSDGPGQGSLFRVTLPLEKSNESYEKQDQAA